MDSKFGSWWGEWCSNETPEPYEVGLWKNIKKGWRMISSHTRFQMGDGFKIRFWHDVWCREKALKEAFPNLYSIACMKDTYVAIQFELSSGSLQWNASFIRATHNWEVDVFASFFNLLYSYRVRREGEGKIWWAPSKKCLFVVSSFYSVLICNDYIHFPWKSIWKTIAPLRATFFAWSAALKKILTMDNLRKQHIIVVNRCCMCKRNGVSVDHLLLHCEASCAMECFLSHFRLS